MYTSSQVPRDKLASNVVPLLRGTPWAYWPEGVRSKYRNGPSAFQSFLGWEEERMQLNPPPIFSHPFSRLAAILSEAAGSNTWKKQREKERKESGRNVRCRGTLWGCLLPWYNCENRWNWTRVVLSGGNCSMAILEVCFWGHSVDTMATQPQTDKAIEQRPLTRIIKRPPQAVKAIKYNWPNANSKMSSWLALMLA